MKSKLNYLIGISLKRKIKSKWFVIVNIILAIAIVGIINIDSIINFFGGDFSQKQSIYVIDNTNEAYDILNTQLGSIDTLLESDESSFELKKYDSSEEDAKKLIEENKKNIVVVLFSYGY